MKMIHGTAVKETLHALKPKYIAVAYVGADWQSFVDVSSLQEIILSPTIGSSADAIKELAGFLGWERVHFLDNLHAKIYLGAKAAAVGSFNLTANGLSGHALIETGYLVDGAIELKKLKRFYVQLKMQANRDYGNQTKKERRVSELIQCNDRLRQAGLAMPQSSRKRTLAEYEPATATDFYCSFYHCDGRKVNVAELQRQAPEKFLSP